MRVLIVKLSSMGDLIQALPALTDAKQAIPGIEFDWVVDEAFAEIPVLHHSVKNIIKSAHRRWSRNKWATLKNGEVIKFWRELRANQYDIVIDAQNNLKSALVTRLSRGLRCGMDQNSVREKGAHLAYQKKVSVPGIKDEHAITRMRRLFAEILDYPLPTTPPQHGIDLSQIPNLPFELPERYLVFMHSTTWSNKHWPESNWAQLVTNATRAGYHVVFPWGNQKEFERSQRLAAVSSAHTTVLPRLNIKQQARVMLGATGSFTLDTGLGHLAAALDVPTVHLYGPTDPKLLGVFTPHQQYLIPDYSCVTCYLRECKFATDAECFVKGLEPTKVWGSFERLLVR